MKDNMCKVAGGAAKALRHTVARGLCAVIVGSTAMFAGVQARAITVANDHIASRGAGVGTYAFSCFHNYSTYSPAFQVNQGSLYVGGTVGSADRTFEKMADGSLVAHIVKDTYLNGMTAYPVRAFIDIKMTNSTYKVGTIRWLVTNRPGAAVQRTWMNSAAVYGNTQGYLPGSFATDLACP
jgi:hypothetical protein